MEQRNLTPDAPKTTWRSQLPRVDCGPLTPEHRFLVPLRTGLRGITYNGAPAIEFFEAGTEGMNVFPLFAIVNCDFTPRGEYLIRAWAEQIVKLSQQLALPGGGR